METYIVQGNKHHYFVKVGAPVERYLVLAELGLSPPVLSYGELESGKSILIQPFLQGRNPSRADFQTQWERVAALVSKMHADPPITKGLPPALSNSYKEAGLNAWRQLVQRWERYKAQVPAEAAFVDRSLDDLEQQINRFSSEGLVTSHNDICNANWIFTSSGEIYIVDLESMCRDDPALDMGALLWWYYPPEQRRQFLESAGYPYDDEFKFRMRVRMAMHCLSITLPREDGFEEFHPDRYHEALTDFRAALAGKENPQGYIS